MPDERYVIDVLVNYMLSLNDQIILQDFASGGRKVAPHNR